MSTPNKNDYFTIHPTDDCPADVRNPNITSTRVYKQRVNTRSPSNGGIRKSTQAIKIAQATQTTHTISLRSSEPLRPKPTFVSSFAPIGRPVSALSRKPVAVPSAGNVLQKYIVEPSLRVLPAVFSPDSLGEYEWPEYHKPQCDALRILFQVIESIYAVNNVVVPSPTSPHGAMRTRILQDMKMSVVKTVYWHLQCALLTFADAMKMRCYVTNEFYGGVWDEPHLRPIVMIGSEIRNIIIYSNYIEGIINGGHPVEMIDSFVFVEAKLATETKGVVFPENCRGALTQRSTPNIRSTAMIGY